MHFARADTYINVYLPRPDGEEPRRYASPPSPVFNSQSTYKFSDQIVRDRPLFLGRKQMSLYEIYYKDNKDGAPEMVADAPDEKNQTENDTETDEKNKESETEKSTTFVGLPSVKKVSISLDYRVRKSARSINARRFNEPLNAYITNRKKVQTIHNFDPSETIERQLTTLEMLSKKREPIFSDSNTKIRTLHRIIKKTQSAPADLIRTPRALGLPPIVIGNGGLAAVNASPPTGKVTYKLAGKAMPVRPSSKPHSIWRQTTDLLPERKTPRLMTADKYISGQTSRIRVGVGIHN